MRSGGIRALVSHEKASTSREPKHAGWLDRS
jgi:hypothetical protein